MAISNLGVSNRNSKGIAEIDFGFFKINFLAQESKIEIEFQVLRSRFLIFWEPKFFKNQNFDFHSPKFQNRNRISSFDIPISHFSETKF